MKVGFIGLGIMGSGIANNILKAGHSLTVLDLRPEAIKPLLKSGATRADSPKAVAEANDIIFTSLPGPPDVEKVALGEKGLIEGIHKGGVYIDLTSNSPTLVRRIYDRFKEKGAHVMDVPVSGGPTGAQSGTLTLMVGGDEDVFQRCKPVLSAIGDKITYTGKIGCGSVCKLMHNCIGYGLQTIVAECLTLGVKAGVEPMSLWRVLRDGGTGQGVMFHKVLPDVLLRGHFDPPHFALRLAFKDVSLATSLGRELDVPMAIANLTLQEMMSAMNRGWGDRDSRVSMLLQEERAGGIEVRIPESQLIDEEARRAKK
jgi:3-hydroxyisobutyrate dehydrogenase-like beta-hydroxyacid dehydrogenase